MKKAVMYRSSVLALNLVTVLNEYLVFDDKLISGIGFNHCNLRSILFFYQFQIMLQLPLFTTIQ